MYGNNLGKSGKNVSEDEMSNAALIEAKTWADDLMSREFKGRGDKEYLARYRLSPRIGTPSLFRDLLISIARSATAPPMLEAAE